jgi:branched-chain amino acid transport system substrate-binding protein
MRNVMLKRKGAGITVLAVGLPALLLLTACTPAPTLPTGKVVEIGYMSPFTGAGASQEQVFLSAVLDYARYFSDEEMIPGVSVKVRWEDVGSSDLPRFVSAYQRFRARGVSVMLANQIPGLMGYQSRFELDQVPLYTGNPMKEIVYPPGWYYFRSPTWAEQFASLADYIIENWQEAGPPKLTLIAVDNVYAMQPIPEAIEYAASLGIEILPTEWVSFVVLDASTQLLRAREDQADFVYISGLVPTSGPIVRDAERLGLLDQIHFTGAEPTCGEMLIKMAGSAAEGYLVPKTLPTFGETEVPGIKLMEDVQMKYHGKAPKQEEYIYGWTGQAIICEAIMRAVENVGYENLDGLAIKQAFDSIKDFDVDGLVTITYTPEDHRGSNKVAIYQVRDGKLVRASDWREAPMLVPQKS